MKQKCVEIPHSVDCESTLAGIKRRSATRRYRIAHREQIAARKALHYRANRDRILKYKRAHYAAHCEELKAKRRARHDAKQRREFNRMKRVQYLFRHPEVTRQWYDAEVRRREKFDLQHSPEWRAAERRRTEAKLHTLQRRMHLKELAA